MTTSDQSTPDRSTGPDPSAARGGETSPGGTAADQPDDRSVPRHDSALADPEPAEGGGPRPEPEEQDGPTSQATDASDRLFPDQRAQEYSTRWDSVKACFVDEPRQAVGQADQLVSELLDELQELFRTQRASLEKGLDNDQTTTEDLRNALHRYRSFFDRLLSV
jgi:hypothetical protein